MTKSVLLFYCFACILACQTDYLEPTQLVENNELSYPNVDQRLWSYFQNFEIAATERGITADLSKSGIRAVISEIPEEGIAGQCSYGGARNSRSITIDLEFWNRSSSLYKEYIIFHELGHCLLNRGHLDACFSNRTYVSMMRSGYGSCRDNYTGQTRDYYLDELFGLEGN